MKKLSYQQAYDKIIDAYFKDEILPFSANHCFCGTLSPDVFWNLPHNLGIRTTEYPYTQIEYIRMEHALFQGMQEFAPLGVKLAKLAEKPYESLYEDAIFNGMCKAIGVLQQIHYSRGEVIDETPVFRKRILQPQKI